MYPSELQYKYSVENKMYPPTNGGYRFSPVLNNTEVVLSSGGRAVVFKVTEDTSGKSTALKFFTVEDQNRFQHYLEISNYLKSIKSNFLVNFKIIEKLIYVDADNENPENNYFPGLVMDWANGNTLQSKLQDLCLNDEKNKILILKENFKKLAQFLHSENIAHGDLKHDNIIVTENLDLILVDYDGIFIPPFKGLQSSELGTSSFQHPSRKNTDFNQRIDDFSILTIYTSLIALKNNPSLFNKYYDEQNLLFRLEDFINPNKSELFESLSNDPETKALAYYIKKSLASESIYIDNLNDLLNGVFPKPSIVINQTPQRPLIGQKVKISWETSNADFVNINGIEQSITGSIEVNVKHNHKLDFEFGNEIETIKEVFTFESIPLPEILVFKANSTEITSNETVNLTWEVNNFIKAKLNYNNEQLDVTNQKSFTIEKLEKDTIIQLQLFSEIDNYLVEKELIIKVFYPVTLEVKQDKNITFPNRPINLKIESTNAQKVILQPSNIDLTGKSNYEIITDSDFKGYIIAENKRFTAPIQHIVIEVLKIPERPHIIAKLPSIEFKIPIPQFIKINNPEPRGGQKILKQFKTTFEYLNIFKLPTNLKRLYETRRK